MKNGLLLTLKELIKLGVIKIKKRRRRGLSTTKKSIQAQLPSVQQSMGQDKYNAFVTTSAPNPQAYSDALRLRDENRNFDTRLLEYKNEQQQQKLLLKNQQQLQQRLQQIQQQQQLSIDEGTPAVQYLLAKQSQAPLRGFVEDDNVDVTEVNGSDDFKTQQDIADPELREINPVDKPRSVPPLGMPPQQAEEPPQQLIKYSSEDEYEDIPEEQTTTVPSTKKYITKKLKSQIEQKMKFYPNLTKEQAKELVLMETTSARKKKKRPKKKLPDDVEIVERFGLTPEQFI